MKKIEEKKLTQPSKAMRIGAIARLYGSRKRKRVLV
jgi:hypothetical protein